MSCLSHCGAVGPIVGETLQIYAFFFKDRYVFRKNVSISVQNYEKKSVP